MKNLVSLVVFFIVMIIFSSCKSDQQKKAEVVTNAYIRFIDSVANKGTTNAVSNWSIIAREFEEKSNELNSEIDKLEDITIFDNKINPATEKYEAFKKSAFEKRTDQTKLVDKGE